MVGYVDTYQTIKFNGNVYPNIPWEITKEHEDFIEYYRAMEFYEIDFQDKRAVQIVNEEFRNLLI